MSKYDWEVVIPTRRPVSVKEIREILAKIPLYSIVKWQGNILSNQEIEQQVESWSN